EPLLDLSLQAGKQRDRDEQRGDADGQTEHADARHHDRVRAAACAPEITAGDARFDHARGRINGKRITSRIDDETVRIIATRAMPTPSPAVGGMPYSSAFT